MDLSGNASTLNISAVKDWIVASVWNTWQYTCHEWLAYDVNILSNFPLVSLPIKLPFLLR